MTKTVGVVLAGGLSRRFGSPKAFAKLGDRYFYEIAIDALKKSCNEIIIVTRSELVGDFPKDLHVILDNEEFRGLGPLAGILSAMEFVEADRYAVLPCDMPYIDETIYAQLLELHEKDVTAVIANERFHPLVSVWSGRTQSVLREALEKQELRVMNMLAKVDVSWIKGSSLTNNEIVVFKNVNTPDSLERG